MHELKIMVKPFRNANDSMQEKSYELNQKSFKATIDYFRKEQGTAENIVKIEGIVIPPLSEIVISFGISKFLREWETYPNDPSRGFNIMQMPVYYRAVESPSDWFRVESAPLLVQIPEPDFSMPFNVNAATNAVLGVFMINMYYVLMKAKRFAK